MSEPRQLTVRAFAERIGKPAGWPTEAALRQLIHHDVDGFRSCIRKIGKRILIDLDDWNRWIDARRVKRAPRPSAEPVPPERR